MQRIAFSTILLGLVCGCAVKASNPGPPPGKFTLRGTLTHTEDGAPAADKLLLRDAKGKVLAETIAHAGRYEFKGLTAGSYSLAISDDLTSPLTVNGDVHHDVLLPRPAAPGRPRAYGGQGVLCVLWDDRSGIETAYHVAGSVSFVLPADAIGIRVVKLAAERAATGVWVFAENQYGNSVSASATAAEYPPKNLVDRHLCRNVTVITP